MVRHIWLICVGLWLASSALLAGAKSDVEQVSVAVVDALRQESASQDAPIDRRALLANEPNADAAARWQSGFVKHDKTWQSWDVSPIVDAQLLRDYQHRRDGAGATAAAQLKLADWCREAGLKDQERTHLFQALGTGQLSNPVVVLRRLGYRQVGMQWLTDAELVSASQLWNQMNKEWMHLQPRLEKIAQQLEGKPSGRQKAMDETRSIATRHRIAILEHSLGKQNEKTAEAYVELMSEIKTFQSSQSLARTAVMNASPRVRELATRELKNRRMEEFVPVVLNMMYEPINVSQHTAFENQYRDPISKNAVFRAIFSREGRDRVELAVLQIIDHRFSPVAQQLPNSSRELREQLRTQNLELAALDTYQHWLNSAESMNEQSEMINQHAATLLNELTGLSLPVTANIWWKWWADYIDSPESSTKPSVNVHLESVDIEYRPDIRARLPGVSCLVAGTPVWTEEGFRPIEQIRIGDRVLSKNIETGELKYQPVLHTTHRADAALSELKIGDETIEASLGHNFWISGRGWTRTNQLQDGMPVHTPTGTVRVEVASSPRTADVYNLVVNEFHTYFVGKSMLLGHDVIVPSPTDIRVPGLDPDLVSKK